MIDSHISDIKWMKRAIYLASLGKGRTSPNPMVGAVILDKNGNLISEGFHSKSGMPHAEAMAFNNVKKDARNGTIYVNLEPCCHQGKTPPCVDKIISFGLKEVFVSIVDPDKRVSGKGIKLLKDAGITYGGAGSKREEFTEADKELPYYPLVKDATDVNVFTTGDAKYDSRDMSEYITNAKSNATPMYPFNKALYTESGHILELDDTRGNERISVEHRTGTFYEIDADGNEIHRVVNDNYTVICKDNDLFVGGNVNVRVLGDAKIHANGKVDIKGYNDGKIDVSGKLELSAGDNITLKSGKEVIVQAQKFRPNS